MFQPTPSLSASERQLLKLFKGLAEEDRATLLKFAEFLEQRATDTSAVEALETPRDIPRPGKETVIAAIKRLSRTYPMVDKGLMLHDTSALMTQHVLQGKEASQVIDELEELFRRHYQRLESSR